MEQKTPNDLNEINHPLPSGGTMSLLTQPKTLNQLLYNKYGEITEDYNNLYIDALIYSKQSHIFTCYKDNLIWNYIDEFLKRYYTLPESTERLPRISNYYKNYLKFFCSPIFRHFKLNDLIQSYGDNKAEIYYKKTYSKKKANDIFNENVGDNSAVDDGSERSTEKKNFSTLFNTTIKQNIEQNILTESCRAESLNFSSVTKYDCYTRRSRGGDSIEKILANLGVDINGRFINKVTKKNNLINKKSVSTNLKNDKMASSNKTKGKNTSTPNKPGTKNNSITTKTTSVSPFHANYVGNIINVVNIGVNMGNVGVNLVGNSIGINGLTTTVTKGLKNSTDFGAFYSNFQNVATSRGGSNKVSLCSIYKANPWQQVKPVIKKDDHEKDRTNISKKHTVNDFRKKKHSSVLCESQRINSSNIRASKVVENVFNVKKSFNSQIVINSPKEAAGPVINKLPSRTNLLLYSKSPPLSAKPKVTDAKSFNTNRSTSNANLKSTNLNNGVHKRESSSKLSNFIDCSQKLLNNYKSPNSIIKDSSRNTQSNLFKLSSNPIKNSSIDKNTTKKNSNLQEFLKHQKPNKSKVDTKSQSRKTELSSRILNPSEDKKKSFNDKMHIKDKTSFNDKMPIKAKTSFNDKMPIKDKTSFHDKITIKDKTRKIISLYSKTVSKK
jgi:hypothetical protein